MIALRQTESKSWLSPYAGLLAAELRERLQARCRGERGVFLTLTYSREEWASPHDLYRRASEERHVRRFIEELGAKLGESLTGRWLCKLEFQEGGWVHWHLIILGVPFMPHRLVEDCWGMGFVWLRRLTPRALDYVCKYVSKGGELPTFLLGERARSVKVIRVSPGFWQQEYERVPRERSVRMPFYVPIGDCLERARQQTTLRLGPESYVSVHAEFAAIVLLAVAMGARVYRDGGWLVLDGVEYVAGGGLWVGDEELLSGRRCASTPPAWGAGLHLMEGRNPPEVLTGWRRWYLQELLEDEFRGVA